jgi:hypothetical protein
MAVPPPAAQASRQLRSCLIFDARQKIVSSSKDISAGSLDTPHKRKRVWPLNVLSVLLIGVSLSLSSPDSFSQAISGLSLAAALGSSYFSLRRRFTWPALLLLLVAAYFQVFYLIFMFKR